MNGSTEISGEAIKEKKKLNHYPIAYMMKLCSIQDHLLYVLNLYLYSISHPTCRCNHSQTQCSPKGNGKLRGIMWRKGSHGQNSLETLSEKVLKGFFDFRIFRNFNNPPPLTTTVL